MWMAWGPELVFLYNDTYRKITLGEKHSWALRRPASQRANAQTRVRDCSEGILSGCLFCGLCSLSLLHWINADSEQPASLGVAFPC
jgi:hypothetical protein